MQRSFDHILSPSDQAFFVKYDQECTSQTRRLSSSSNRILVAEYLPIITDTSCSGSTVSDDFKVAFSQIRNSDLTLNTTFELEMDVDFGINGENSGKILSIGKAGIPNRVTRFVYSTSDTCMSEISGCDLGTNRECVMDLGIQANNPNSVAFCDLKNSARI